MSSRLHALHTNATECPRNVPVSVNTFDSDNLLLRPSYAKGILIFRFRVRCHVMSQPCDSLANCPGCNPTSAGIGSKTEFGGHESGVDVRPVQKCLQQSLLSLHLTKQCSAMLLWSWHWKVSCVFNWKMNTMFVCLFDSQNRLSMSLCVVSTAGVSS